MQALVHHRRALPTPVGVRTPVHQIAAETAVWDDILDEDGGNIPCTPENIERVTERPYFASAAAGAYLRRFHPRKNF